jgi:diguanylate cyclase
VEPAVDHLLVDSLMDGPMGVGLFDPQERLRRANEAFLGAVAARLDGAPTWEALMRDCHRRRRGLLIETEDINAWIAHVRRRHRQVPERSFESHLVDGRWMWVSETLRPDGWVLVLMTDITALRSGDAARAIAQTTASALAELPNRRQIFSRLDDLLAVSTQMRVPLSVVVLHIDRFMHITALHGDVVGERMLRHLAEQLRNQLRSLDAVGRIGGEEFLLLLPNTPPEGAEQALQRLQAVLQEQVLVPGLPGLRCVLSAGVALALPGDTAASVFNRADRALYLVRARGAQAVGVVQAGGPGVGALLDRAGAGDRPEGGVA